MVIGVVVGDCDVLYFFDFREIVGCGVMLICMIVLKGDGVFFLVELVLVFGSVGLVVEIVE